MVLLLFFLLFIKCKNFANINKKIVERKKNIEIWKVISQYCSVKYFEKLNVIGTKISENIKIILTIRKGHGILIKLFRTTEMIEADSEKEK